MFPQKSCSGKGQRSTWRHDEDTFGIKLQNFTQKNDCRVCLSKFFYWIFFVQNPFRFYDGIGTRHTSKIENLGDFRINFT